MPLIVKDPYFKDPIYPRVNAEYYEKLGQMLKDLLVSYGVDTTWTDKIK